MIRQAARLVALAALIATTSSPARAQHNLYIGNFHSHCNLSNDAMGRFGPPDFEQARFVLDQPELTLEIEAVTAF